MPGDEGNAEHLGRPEQMGIGRPIHELPVIIAGFMSCQR